MLFFMMLGSAVLSLIIGIKILDAANKEENELEKFSAGLAGVFFLFLSVSGTFGIFVKTFEIWGNGW